MKKAIPAYLLLLTTPSPPRVPRKWTGLMGNLTFPLSIEVDFRFSNRTTDERTYSTPFRSLFFFFFKKKETRNQTATSPIPSLLLFHKKRDSTTLLHPPPPPPFSNSYTFIHHPRYLLFRKKNIRFPIKRIGRGVSTHFEDRAIDGMPWLMENCFCSAGAGREMGRGGGEGGGGLMYVCTA